MTSIRIAFATALAIAALLAGADAHHAQATHAVHTVAAVHVTNGPGGCCMDDE